MIDPDRQNDSLDRLRRTLQPVRLSPAQRRRHRRRMTEAFETRSVEANRMRGKVELAVVALALLAVISSALIWGSLGDGGADEEAQHEAALATAEALTMAALENLPGYEPAACAATPYATMLPAGIPRQDPAFANWYGSDAAGLWAAPVDRSAFRRGPIAAATHWYAGPTSYVMWYGTTQPLEIVGRRLDGEETFTAGRATHTQEALAAQWTAFEIPSAGCWSIAASAGEASLEIVVSVAPLEWRPDIFYLQRVAAARPFEAQATCATSRQLGPEATSGWYAAAFALEEDDLRMSINQGWLTAGRLEPLHFMGGTLAGSVQISARQADVRLPFRLRGTTGAGRFGDFVFPHAGCWEIEVETPEDITTFTVYVYPQDCAPAPDTLQIPATCRQPGG